MTVIKAMIQLSVDKMADYYNSVVSGQVKDDLKDGRCVDTGVLENSEHFRSVFLLL